jgi:predicted MFS family arabinose efflux permease
MTTAQLRAVARERGVRAQLATYVLARLPSGMMILSLLLQVHARLGALAGTGSVVAAYTVTVAGSAPFAGRLLDQHGARRVLPVAAAVHLLGISFVAAGQALPTLLVGAVLAGIGLPQTPAYVRSEWQRLPAELRPAVFALDGIILEAANIVGPLLVALVVAVAGPAACILVSGGCVVVAAVGAAFALPGAAITPVAARHWLGPLRVPAVPLLLAVLGLVTAGYAFIEVGVVAYATAHHRPAVSGILFGAMSIGSVAGGAVMVTRHHGRPLPTLLPHLCLLLAAGFALLPLAGGNTVALIVLLVVGTASTAPVFTALFTALGDSAPAGQRTETFTWVSSSNFAAISAGTFAAGQLLQHASLTAAYLTAALVIAAAAAVSLPAVGALSRMPAPASTQ